MITIIENLTAVPAKHIEVISIITIIQGPNSPIPPWNIP